MLAGAISRFTATANGRAPSGEVVEAVEAKEDATDGSAGEPA